MDSSLSVNKYASIMVMNYTISYGVHSGILTWILLNLLMVLPDT